MGYVTENNFLLLHIMKQIDCTWVYSVTDDRRHQNVLRTSVTSSLSPFFCFYHILTSSVICY